MQLYDIAIIGAGIHGAGVAQAAAQQGLSVLVLERREQAGLETSSASSKLIHGGLRYLETGQFRLVYECLREQKMLLTREPQLVAMRTFYLPVYKNSKRHPLLIALGLGFYWLLSGCRTQLGCWPIAKSEATKIGLREENLRALFAYQDAQTDDRQLTQAVLKVACELGCSVEYRCELQALNKGEHYHLHCSDDRAFQARTLVNAAGPWVNHVASLLPGMAQQNIDWVQGTHIVLDQPALDVCIYCESPRDGRAVFILPWKGKALVGTTEMMLSHPKAQVTEEEVDYLLDVFNCYFPKANCTSAHVLDSFAGVRVLPKAEGAANRRSRETLFVCDSQDRPTYVAIYGGKLTSFRATAEKALNRLRPHITARH